MIILDTNILIDLDLYTFTAEETYGASILSRAELEFGVQSGKTPLDIAHRSRRLTRLDTLFDWIRFDLASTRSYGAVAANATSTGAKVRSKDALIAAQAHQHGASVMTANQADFAPFRGMVEILAPTPKSLP